MLSSLDKGLFITLEGVEGAGKSTLINYIQDILLAARHRIVITREPGGTKTGEQLRAILLDSDNIHLSNDTELLLIFASRAQHIQEVIQPALLRGDTVLCDRFTDSSYAYQGGGRGLEQARIKQLEDWVQQGLKPDLTLLFDLDVEIGLQRAGRRLFKADRFEQEKISFFKRIRACYLERARNEPERFRVIDATQSQEMVQQQLQVILSDYPC